MDDLTRDADPDRDLITRELGGQYQIVRPLGRGAMGSVYLARDRALHRMVAIKALRSDRFDDPEERERFRGEARLSVQLNHPGIVPVYTFGETPSLLYSVMQYVEGGSLADRLRRTGGRLSADDTRQVLLEIADVLDYAHRQGVIHRDVKPENVLLAGSGPSVHVVLGDFGVAAQPFRDRGAGKSGVAAGSAHYMSPEQLWGELDVDRRSDVYAIGVLGYRLLSGTVPYDGANTATIAAKRATGVHTPLRAAAPHVSQGLCDVIERCLEREPERRWRNARELHAALLHARSRRSVWSRLARAFPWGSTRPRRDGGSPPHLLAGRGTGAPAVRSALRELASEYGIVAIAALCLASSIAALTAR